MAMGISVVEPTNDMYASAYAGVPSEGNDYGVRSSHSKLTTPLHRVSLASSILSVKLNKLQGIRHASRTRNDLEQPGNSHNT